MKVTESNDLYSLTREGKAQAHWKTRGEAGWGGILQVFQNAFSFVFPPPLPYSMERVSRHERPCTEAGAVVFIIIKGNRHFSQCKNSICDLLWRDCYQYTPLFLSASRAKAHSFIEGLTRNVGQTFFSSGNMCIQCVFSSEEKFLFFIFFSFLEITHFLVSFQGPLRPRCFLWKIMLILFCGFIQEGILFSTLGWNLKGC